MQHSSEAGSSSSAWGTCTCLPACCGFRATVKLPCSVRWPVGRAGSDNSQRASPCKRARRLRTLHDEVGYELGGVASILQKRRDAPRVALIAGLRAHKPCSGQDCMRALAWVVNAPLHTWRVSPAAQPPMPAHRRETPGHARAAAGGTLHVLPLRVTSAPRLRPAAARARSCRCAAANKSRACTPQGKRQQFEAGPPEGRGVVHRGRRPSGTGCRMGGGTAASRSAAPECGVACMRSGFGARMRRQRCARCAAHALCC